MKRILVIIISSLMCLSAYAENELTVQSETENSSLSEAEASPSNKVRPRVGVVLSGGGAKGMAHIGVLKAIEQLGIPVDFIVGTSIGSIMAGFYALGYSADELDSLVRAQNWDEIMNDDVARRRVSYEQKKLNEKYVISVPFKNRQTFDRNVAKDASDRPTGIMENLPSALVSGQNLNKLFTKLSVGYQDNVDFKTFPIPFACVAVDLNTNKEVVFHEGNIVDAIRSSMSIPGYFAPIEKNGMCLIDGGIINNFPVDVARDMGADIVIGVDLHHHRRGNVEPVRSLGDMVSRMLDTANGGKYESGREDADILVNPNTSEYGVLSFDLPSINALIDSGYVAALEVWPELAQLAESQHELAEKEALATVGPTREEFHPRKAIDLARDSVLISQISIEGADPHELSWLLSKTQLKPGTYLTGHEIDEAMATFYDTRAFAKIEFAVTGNEDDQYGLKIKFDPRKIHTMGVGFRYDTEEAAAILLGVGLNKNKLFGWKFDADLKLATNVKLDMQLGYTFHNMMQLNLSSTIRYSDLPVHNAGELMHTPYVYLKGQADLQTKSPKNADVRLGARYSSYARVNFNTGNDIYPDPEATEPVTVDKAWSAFLSYDFDNFDHSYFPTKGSKHAVTVSYNLPDLHSGFEGQFVDARLDFKGIIPFGQKVALIPQLYNRWVIGDAPYIFRANFAGGAEKRRYVPTQLSFVGFNYLYAYQSKIDIARFDLRINIKGNHFMTLKANGLFHFDKLNNIMETYDWETGYGIGYAMKTIVGPVGLDVMWTKSTGVAGYLSIGYSF